MKANLSRFLSKIPENAFVKIEGNPLQIRNGDVHYLFRQNSDFLYLTGLSVPNMVLTIFQKKVILWRDSVDEFDTIWGSDKIPDEEIVQISGISDIREKNDLDEYIEQRRESQVFDTTEVLIQMRLYKTPNEIEKIRKAITITDRAFGNIEPKIHPGMYEYEVEALFAYEFRKAGMTEAYPTIIASGKNACTLHYTKHHSQIQQGDFLLIDAGCEYKGYASDWTRTFAIGDISSRQDSIKESVEQVKTFAESILKPGIQKSDYEKQVRQAMIVELEKLGLIDSEISENEKIEQSRIYYPHSTSHFLGLDVHDVGPRDILIDIGMVLTIEPGIYIPEEGIGVRLEDDYLVTKNGCEKLLPCENEKSFAK